MTVEQLLARSDLETHCELVEGELVTISPSGLPHGALALELGSQLRIHVKKHKLGVASGAETGFVIGRDPDTMLAPDVAFVAADRLPDQWHNQAFQRLAPDLVVEIVSPDDRATKVHEKAKRWLAAGCKMVLVVEPKAKKVKRYTSPDKIDVFDQNTNVDCSQAVPGWVLNTVELFDL